jgi:hypothetical protein
LSDFIFAEQKRNEDDYIMTVAVFMNDEELNGLVLNQEISVEAIKILNGEITWEEASDSIRNYVSLYITDLQKVPIKNTYNDRVYEILVQRQLELRQQSLEDFAIDQILSGEGNKSSKVYIRHFKDKLYTTDKQVIVEKMEVNMMG